MVGKEVAFKPIFATEVKVSNAALELSRAIRIREGLAYLTNDVWLMGWLAGGVHHAPAGDVFVEHALRVQLGERRAAGD
jgi:hypothetical protein